MFSILPLRIIFLGSGNFTLAAFTAAQSSGKRKCRSTIFGTAAKGRYVILTVFVHVRRVNAKN